MMVSGQRGGIRGPWVRNMLVGGQRGGISGP
jgi:hypothetical protein